MPVDPKVLKARCVSSGAYKAIFAKDPVDYPPRIKKLVDLLRNRAQDGYQACFQDWKAYQAIDLAYDVPFNQTTPTFITNILSKGLTEDEMKKELKAYGLSESELFLDIEVEGKKYKTFNPPIFFQIFVPLVKAYCSVRIASLYNERNTNPIMPLKPLKDTEKNATKCAIWEDLLNTIGTWYGYSAVKRQAIQQTVKYGINLAFTREEWHCEKQLFSEDPNGENAKEKVVKEGLRYIQPHPSRMFYDLQYPLTTLNTDSGIEFAGHWSINRYGDLLDNRKYWNRDKILPGENWFTAPSAGQYFKEVYPCTLSFPVQETNGLKREDRAAFYNQRSDRDSAVFVCEQICKLVPRNWGLGDYNYPVWHRFTMAGDSTIIWAAPSVYTPAFFTGYDYDENMAKTSSLALELIPWQDHLGNILSQMLLTAKQNLANVIFYNNQAVDKEDIKKISNSGERKYRGMNFIGYDALKFGMSRVEVDKIFTQINFNRASIQEFIQMLPMFLSILERVLQISAQEAGAQGTHQQSKEEILTTQSGSASRKNFTASYIDEGFDAMSRQNVEGCLAYMEPDFAATISSEIENLDAMIKELGFKVTGRTQRTVSVEGKKHVLRLEGFAAATRNPDPSHDKELAQAMFNAIGTVANNPALLQTVGAKSIIKLIEHAAIMAGAPKDFKLPPMEGSDQQGGLTPAIMQAIQKAQQATIQAIQEKIAQPAATEVHQLQAEVEAHSQALKQFQKIFEIANANNDKLQIEKARFELDSQIKIKESQLENQRKDLESQAKIQRDQKMAAAKIQIDTAKAAADVHTKALTTEMPQAEAPTEEPSAMEQVLSNIKYGDTPPSVQAQLETKLGVTPAPASERVSAKEELKAKTAAKNKAAKPAANPKAK